MKNKITFEKKEIVFILTGFGLGDLFNFGFYLLPGILKIYKKVHIITDFEENIFQYELGVIWHFSSYEQMDTILENVLLKYQNLISKVIYLDNHPEFVILLKKIITKYKICLLYPSRSLITKLVGTEKSFYFNIYINLVRFLDPSIVEIDKKIQLYGENEKNLCNKLFTKHKVSKFVMNIVIIPESRKKVKSITAETLENIVTWFNSLSINSNVFIVSKNPKYFLPKTYFVDSFKVSEVCCLINKADVCVSVDTGFIHVANYFKKNIIGLFGPTSMENSLYSHKNVLEISNLIQKQRCPFYMKNVYTNPCVKTDKCLHQT